jgi:hypothetical protein
MEIPAEVYLSGEKTRVNKKNIHHDHYGGQEVEIKDEGTIGAIMIKKKVDEEKGHFPITIYVGDSIGLDSGALVVGTED